MRSIGTSAPGATRTPSATRGDALALTSMQALVLATAGGPSALRAERLPMPVVAPGHVRVRVDACGLNPVDVGLSRGGNPAWDWPHVLGLDIAGTIDEVSSGSGWQVGMRVAFHGDLRTNGGLAEYAVADELALAPIPDGLDSASAAAIPCAGMTAYQAVISRLRVAAGDTVVVAGGNGGVAGFAIQLAARAGARVIATASSHHDRLRSLGAHEVIDYRHPDAVARIRSAAGDSGIDAVVDAVGSANATAHLPLLNYSGGIACVAGRADLSVVPAFTTAPSVHEIALGAAYSAGRAADRKSLGNVLRELLGLAAAGELDPTLTRVIGIAEVPDALESLGSRRTVGKIVATWPTASTSPDRKSK